MFDNTVFERMKRDDGHPAADRKKRKQPVDHLRDYIQFPVDLNADCLKGSSGRMRSVFAVFRRNGVFDKLGQFKRRFYRCFLARTHNITCNFSGKAFFAVQRNHARQLFFRIAVDHVIRT